MNMNDLAESPKTIFQTTDLALAALLRTSQILLEVDRSNPRKVVFYFSKSPELDNIVQEYFLKKLLVEPQQFLYDVKSIKSLIYQ